MNAKRSIPLQLVLHKALVLIVITSLLVSGSGFPVSARSAVPSTAPDLSVLMDQCANPQSELGYQSQTGTIRFIGTAAGNPIPQPIGIQASSTPEEAARAYLSLCGPLFGLSGQPAELELKSQSVTDDGRSVVRFRQTYQGVPVFGAELVMQLNAALDVLLVNGDMLSGIELDTAAMVEASAAQQTALQMVAGKNALDSSALTVSAAELWIYNPGFIQPVSGNNSLVWLMEVTPVELMPIRELVLVDAQSGKVALDINQVDTILNRLTYTADNSETRPGTLVCDESNPTCTGGDVDAVNAHVYAGDTYNFYFEYHGRDSIDGAGMSLISTVHYGTGICNAYWNGTQMTYGDGCFIVVDDVVAHEMTHGVTQYESNLIYFYESGAINESLSDIWGEFVDLTNGKGTDTEVVRWYIGEDVSTGAYRYMKDPTVFNDPDKMTSPKYYRGSNDGGGVHTNSGVGNKAAYLITDGDTFNGYTVTGIGITKTAKIYYEAQTNILTSSSNYAALYNALYQACTNLIGTDGITTDDCTQVRNATLATEMNIPLPPITPPANDNFDTPLAVSLPYTHPQDTFGATTAVDDPSIPCVLDHGQKNNSVWYQYTPTWSGDLKINTFGSDYDTVLAVWTGSRGSLSSVACNDDFEGAGGNFQSRVQFAATAGEKYYIEIVSFDLGGGSLVLNASAAPLPFGISSGLTSGAPVIDGVISSGEWADADTYDISDPMLVTAETLGSLSGIPLESIPADGSQVEILLSSGVTLYAMNDDYYLYLAFDNPNDTTSNINDQIGVYFDDNPLPSDGQWTNTACGNADGEGNFWVKLGFEETYREITSGPTYCSEVQPAPGVVGQFGFGSGHAQAEVAIDLTTSAMRAVVGDSINMYIWILDADTNTLHGNWPLTAVFSDPTTYGALTLADSSNPLISGYVRDPGGNGVGGIPIGGLPGNVLTAGNGYYRRTVLSGWSGTVTPQKAGAAFTPASRSYANITTDQTGQNYTVSCTTGHLCVQVSNKSGNPVNGAYVDVYTNYADWPVASYWTDASGWTEFNIDPGNYKLVVSSASEHFLVTKDITAPGIVTVNPTGTVQVNVSARKLDGSALQGATILANPSGYAYGELGTTNTSGLLTAWVTPGTYPFLAWSWDDLYYLVQDGVAVSGTTNVDLHAAAMPTGQMPVTLTDFTVGSVVPMSDQSRNWAPGFSVTSGDVITFSAQDYDVYGDLQKEQGIGTWWYYSLEGKPFSITDGGTTPYIVGGAFTSTTIAGSDTYTAGDDVSITNTISDSYGNRIVGSDRVTPTALPSEDKRLFISSKSGQVRPFSPGGLEVQTWTSVYPHITITNPSSTIISEAQFEDIWNSYTFILPGKSMPGTYQVDLTLDTGPHNGVISANDTFTAIARTCPAGHLCVEVSDKSGNTVSGAYVDVFTDFADPPIESDWTSVTGWIDFGSYAGNYKVAVSSGSEHFLVTKDITAPGLIAVDPTGTARVNVNARKRDGSALQGAAIIANPSIYAHGDMGSTDSNGSLTAWVTPGTYPFMAWSLNDLYYLVNSSVTVAGTTDLNLNAAVMPTGQMPITLAGFTVGFVLPLSDSSRSWAPEFSVSSGDVIIFSATNFDIFGDLRKEQGTGTWWSYLLEGMPYSIASGGTAPYTAGGAFTSTPAADSASYMPGEAVSITDTIKDSNDHRITGVSVTTPSLPGLPILGERQFTLDESGQAKPVYSSGLEAQLLTEVYPHITITNPASAVISEAQTRDTFSGHDFILPGDSAWGTYRATLTLDTGPHNGVISGNGTFHVGLLPPASLLATDGTYTDKVHVSWTASSDATFYKVYRATSASGTKSLLGSPTGTTFDDTTATPGITYTYWAMACNSTSCSDYSLSNTGWRELSPPVNLLATDGTYTDKVRVTWNTFAGATSYAVYRATSASGAKSLLGSPTTAVFDDTTATPGVLYTYWVTVCYDTNCSDYSLSDTGWREISPPANVQASDGTYPDKVLVTWDASEGATSYKVYRAESATGTMYYRGTPTETTFDDTTATPGVTYYYWVVAYRGASYFSGYGTYNIGWRSLTTPANLEASDGMFTDKVLVTWDASEAATSYRVLRATTAAGTKVLRGSPTTTTFDDTSALAGVNYYYWVVACNEGNCSDYGAYDTAWRSVVAVPLNLRATDGTYTDKVVVSWDAVLEATSYRVYRATSISGIKTSLAFTTGITYDDTTAIPGVSYVYWVVSYKGTGFSGYSAYNPGWRKLTAPANLQATDGTYTNKVLVSWTASYGATSYKLYRATSTTGSKTLVGSPTTTSFYDTTAVPGVTYYYWVVAYRDTSLSGYSLYNTGWRKLTAPTGVKASDGIYTTKVLVSWNPSSGATSYKLYRATSATGAKTLRASLTGTTFNDTTAKPGVTYFYWVVAYRGAKYSGYSAYNSGWRTVVPLPVNVRASDGTYTDKVLVSWTASSGATYYEVYRAASATGTKTFLGSPTSASFNDTTATPGVTYTYFVVAHKGTGYSGYSIPDTGWRKLPAPANLLASDGTYTDKVLVSWNASLGATSYKVYRATSATGTKTLLGSPTGTTFNDTTATPGVTYTYWVMSYRGTRYSSYSTANTGWRKITAPANLQASDGTYTDRVRVSWDASLGATSYKVYRATTATGTKSLQGSTSGIAYNDTTATPGVTYYYWVVAYRGTSFSGYSISNTGWRKLIAPASLLASDGTYTDKVLLSWSASSAATSYNVYRATSPTGTKSLRGSPAGTTFNDTNAIPGASYTYWVMACNGASCSDYSAYDTGWRKLSPPTNLQASDGTYTDKVLLTWTASSGASSYRVYRATSPTGTKTLLGTPTGTTFNDLTAIPGITNTYTYWVMAFRGTSYSSYSTSNTGWRKP